MDYFTRLKINKACKLLIQTDMKVNQIGSQAQGFKESQYFSRHILQCDGAFADGVQETEFQVVKLLAWTVTKTPLTQIYYFNSKITLAFISSEAEPTNAWNFPGSATQPCFTGS